MQIKLLVIVLFFCLMPHIGLAQFGSQVFESRLTNQELIVDHRTQSLPQNVGNPYGLIVSAIGPGGSIVSPHIGIGTKNHTAAITISSWDTDDKLLGFAPVGEVEPFFWFESKFDNKPDAGGNPNTLVLASKYNAKMSFGIYGTEARVAVGKDLATAPLDIAGDLLVGQYVESGLEGGADGNIYFDYTSSAIGFRPNHTAGLYGSLGSGAKTFIIDHPLARQRYLVHAMLEGPEGHVYYRGQAQLNKGRAWVHLPDYFESLTRKDGRYVSLQNKNGFSSLKVDSQRGAVIRDGKFLVISQSSTDSSTFYWEVKANRADVRDVAVSPKKNELIVKRDGPYAYIVRQAPESP